MKHWSDALLCVRDVLTTTFMCKHQIQQSSSREDVSRVTESLCVFEWLRQRNVSYLDYLFVLVPYHTEMLGVSKHAMPCAWSCPPGFPLLPRDGVGRGGAPWPCSLRTGAGTAAHLIPSSWEVLSQSQEKRCIVYHQRTAETFFNLTCVLGKFYSISSS